MLATWCIVLALGVVLTVAAIVLLAPRPRVRPASDTLIVRRRVPCPPRGRQAIVEFLVDADGGEVYADVLSCSLLATRDAAGCGRVCRSASVAPFDMQPLRPPQPVAPADPAAPALWCVGAAVH